MEKYAHLFLKQITKVMEFIIACLLTCGIMIMIVKMAASIGYIADSSMYPNYEDLVEICFNLIIGVELIRMLFLHTPITVFEVLMFAIARQIIIDHSSPVNSLIGVVAISILFATRRFLFSPFDETEKTIFRANLKVDMVNRMFKFNIPCNDKDDTLLDVLLAKLEEEGTEPGTGSCAYFSDIILRVAKKKGEEITRIEVIRSIH